MAIMNANDDSNALGLALASQIKLDFKVVDAWLVGSQFTQSPPPPVPPSDIDLLILTSDEIPIVNAPGKHTGYRDQGKASFFVSVKLESNVNAIVTNNQAFAKNFLRATQLSKALNLETKEKRVILFRYVLYGEMP